MKIFQKLLVPLDGSGLAEAALPLAQSLAERLGATVSLLHVLEQGAPDVVHGERHLVGLQEAETYLAGVAERYRWPGVELHVHPNRERDVVASIIGHAEEFGADLIILSTHGWGGVRDILVGSIAQQVLHRGRLPVLLVKPGVAGSPPPFEGKKLLVPLGGTPSHDEAVLPIAEGLAKALHSSLHVLIAVPTVGTMSGDQAAVALLTPNAMAEALEMEYEEAGAYVARIAERLRAEGLLASATARRGDPAGCVAKAAEAIGADLIVMSTHGRAGWEAFWSASTGTKILSRLRQPMLLVRLQD